MAKHAWVANDGSVHETEEAANAHDANLAKKEEMRLLQLSFEGELDAYLDWAGIKPGKGSAHNAIRTHIGRFLAWRELQSKTASTSE